LGCGVAVLVGLPLPSLIALRGHRLFLACLLLLAGGLLLWPFQAPLVYRLVLLFVLALLILLSNVREVQFPGQRAHAWVGSISYSLYLIHNPLQSLVISLALRLGQPEVVAALLLSLVLIMAAVGYSIFLYLGLCA